LGFSEVDLVWETKEDEGAEEGTYRFRYFGDYKNLGGDITGFEGVSGEFRLVSPVK